MYTSLPRRTTVLRLALLTSRDVLRHARSGCARATGNFSTRALPRDMPSSKPRALAYLTLGSALSLSILVAFNHQKSSASITHSTYYAVRRDPTALEVLGNGISYRDYWPWIHGEINQIKGNINFTYAVKGDKMEGMLHFHCVRHLKDSQEWTILDWSIRLPDGRTVPLTRDDLAV